MAQRRHGVFKTSNSYYDSIHINAPKAVFAAIAFSYASAGGEATDQVANENLLREWWILWENGIIPQKPRLPMPSEPQHAT